MSTDFLEEKLRETFSYLQSIEGVKPVDDILAALNDATIFPEITTLIHNSKFELIYLYEEQQILLKTMTNGITIDSSFMQEVHLIYQYKEMIECILTGIIATDKIKNYSLNLLSLKYSELIQSI
ncbi:hypothetical protein FCT18_17370 [Lysinibacillus sphaericus]|uniref:Uncharacterized protein n=1 Tax=Lysinibacillus sphaericus TaxID=1421 RepID=A0A2S0JWZ6_LYSSH|nr:hypothetical protein [Lysinibacillus sphaericus]AVK95660.1 hypothetical protein LS41612_04920 [Lysinibacillus sphaericus]MED4545634.1 hypothetical protein [Lysinibacillus sphaericus]TKI17572.1 hypothetical protein FCT18_17370 [Lysinibacillus sphaericus]SUV18611.1 Uncharacterised protein [Lysinibacillus sphaericus]GEC82806.1 hypothetical protein LSP03_25490 [Lysinibacillus sphaericus]